MPQLHPWFGVDCTLDTTTGYWIIDGLYVSSQTFLPPGLTLVYGCLLVCESNSMWLFHVMVVFLKCQR